MPRPKGSTLAHATAPREPEPWKWASKEQFEAWKYGPYPLCLSGGFGAGKSLVACRKILRLCDAFPGYRVVIARRRWVHLKETTMSTFFKVCPPILYNQGRRSDTDKSLELNNGSKIMWLHLEDDAEVANVIPGLEINAFFIDQAEEVMEEIFDKLSGRLGRWDKAQVPQEMLDLQKRRGKEWKWFDPEGKPMAPSYAILACNPDHELHWIYRRFHPESTERTDKKIPKLDDRGNPTGEAMSYADLGYKMIQMPSTSNRFLPKANLNQLMSQDESFKRRFVRGEWGIPEGTIHIVHPSSILKGTPDLVAWLQATCTLHRTMDYGDSSPTAVGWWAVDGNGNVFCYREYYQPNKLISDHRREVAALSQGEKYQFQLADPSVFYKMQASKGGRWCVADEWNETRSQPRETAVFWQSADNNELGTRNRINEYLRFDPNRMNPITKKPGSPRLFFLTKTEEHPHGVFFGLRELRSQRREKIGTDLGRPIFSDDRDKRVPDHFYDCLRYFIASRPPVALEVMPSAHPMSFRAVHESIQRDRMRGKRLKSLLRKVA